MDPKPYTILGKEASEKANHRHFTNAAFCIEEFIKNIYYKCGYKTIDPELWFGNPDTIITHRTKAYNKGDHAFIVLREGAEDSAEKLEQFLEKLSTKSKQSIDAHFYIDHPENSMNPKTVIIDVTSIVMNPTPVWDALKADINRRTAIKKIGNTIGIVGLATFTIGLIDKLAVMSVPVRERTAAGEIRSNCELGVGAVGTVAGFALAHHAASSGTPSDDQVKLPDMSAQAKRWRLRSAIVDKLDEQGIDMMIDHGFPGKGQS